MALPNRYNIRPASEDPQGDPADAQQQGGVLPASQDPLGDPADAQQGVLPASQDPLGDPADTQQGGVLPASQHPLGDPGVRDFVNNYGQPGYTQQDAQQHFMQMQQHPAFPQAQQEYLANMPPDQFQQSAQQAVNNIPPQQRQQVASGLLGALESKGLNLNSIASQLGLSSANPATMGPQSLANLLGWAQQNHPDALHQAVQDKPWFVQALGNPVVSGVLGALVGKLLNR